HAFVDPAMLVVADQLALGIGRQGGLTGAGQAEKQRYIAFWADVGRAVHRQHALQRQHIVERAEDGLLILARVLGAADQNDLLLDIYDHGGLGFGAVGGRLGVEARRADRGPLRLMPRTAGASSTAG